MINKELKKQRDNTKMCLDILARSRTRDEILEGFNQVATSLRQANDPTANAAEMAYLEGKGLPDDYVYQLKLDFIKQFEAFLSSTEQLEQQLPQARTTKPAGKRTIIAALTILGLCLCFCIMSVIIYLLLSSYKPM